MCLQHQIHRTKSSYLNRFSIHVLLMMMSKVSYIRRVINWKMCVRVRQVLPYTYSDILIYAWRICLIGWSSTFFNSFRTLWIFTPNFQFDEKLCVRLLNLTIWSRHLKNGLKFVLFQKPRKKKKQNYSDLANEKWIHYYVNGKQFQRIGFPRDSTFPIQQIIFGRWEFSRACSKRFNQEEHNINNNNKYVQLLCLGYRFGRTDYRYFIFHKWNTAETRWLCDSEEYNARIISQHTTHSCVFVGSG